MNFRPSLKAFIAIAAVPVFAAAAFAQKGVDTQTTTIKSDSNKVTTRSNDVTARSWNWGQDKTKGRAPLANPYRLGGRRDVLMASVMEALRERKIVVDEASSRMIDGIIITQPYIFSKGSVLTQSGLHRYAILDSSESAWTAARYTLTIEVQSIDGVQNNVSVNAKVEGRAGNGLMSEWVTVRSSGLAEDEFLAKLIELVTGNSPDPVQDTEN